MNNLIYSNLNRGLPPSEKPKGKHKFDFKKMKNNTCKSLNEVEYFLNNLHRFKNYINI